MEKGIFEILFSILYNYGINFQVFDEVEKRCTVIVYLGCP